MLTVMEYVTAESLQVCKPEFKVCDLLSLNKVMPKPPIRSRSGWKTLLQDNNTLQVFAVFVRFSGAAGLQPH